MALPTLSRFAIFLLLIGTVTLLGIGLVMLASTSPWVEAEHLRYSHVKKQMIYLGIGIAGALLAGITPFHLFERFWWLFFTGACILLILCYVPRIGVEVNGARRWIRFPLLGQFQPSEPAKISVNILLAMWMARQQANPQSVVRGFLLPLLFLALPAGLIFFEKDMGTTAVVVASAFLLLYVAGTRGVFLLPTAVAGVIGLIAFVNFSGGNRAARLLAFTNLEETRFDQGLQQYRSLIAFAVGGEDGVGLGNGAEKHDYLPFAHTDFIFPIIAEELGLLFTLLVIMSFLFIAIGGVAIATNCPSRFGSLLAVGLTANIVIQAALNIGVTTALLPNTGLPLPFVSYGGSSLIFTLTAVGLLIGIYARSPHTRETPLTIKRKKKIITL